MRNLLKTLIWVLLLAGLSPAGQGAETPMGIDPASTQKTCPVMANRTIKQKFYTDYQGQRIYFCCGSCVKSFKKNPERYLENLAKK